MTDSRPRARDGHEDRSCSGLVGCNEGYANERCRSSMCDSQDSAHRMWRNARADNRVLDVLRLMDLFKIAVFGIMENRVFGGGLSWGSTAQSSSRAEPRRGLGALVDARVCAAVCGGPPAQKSGVRPIRHIPILLESLRRRDAFKHCGEA